MRAAFVYLRLFVLYLGYWLVGIDEEGFQVQKGNYLVELGFYPAAAKAYQRALRESQSPHIQAALGYCYFYMNFADRAVLSFTDAYSRKPLPEFGIALAWSLHECGRAADADTLYQNLAAGAAGFTEPQKAQLAELDAVLRGLEPSSS